MDETRNLIAWTNAVLMLGNLFFSLYFYCKSAGPAALERKIGERAYTLSATYRKISAVFMVFYTLQYGIYFLFPLPLALPKRFPWPWWVGLCLAVVIAVPSGALLFQGAKYAGAESMTPNKKHRLFRGVYRKIRHPQAVGELPFFWILAFLFHSPFLALFSFLCIPAFYIMCKAEEKDLEIRYGDRYLRYKRRTGMFFPRRSRP